LLETNSYLNYTFSCLAVSGQIGVDVGEESLKRALDLARLNAAIQGCSNFLLESAELVLAREKLLALYAVARRARYDQVAHVACHFETVAGGQGDIGKVQRTLPRIKKRPEPQGYRM